ncbi:MAG: imidazole glycerol phosphate synthase subunit HisH, partial [Frankiales bacterium]|nr:imidazole glycerol phosphate synthase subunit HisH [Frankiales bacterium]
MLVVVLDYGSGNVRSAVRALERVSGELAAGPAASITSAASACSAGSAGSAADEASEREPIEVRLSADRGLAMAADALVVPGVGAFAAC